MVWQPLSQGKAPTVYKALKMIQVLRSQWAYRVSWAVVKCPNKPWLNLWDKNLSKQKYQVKVKHKLQQLAQASKISKISLVELALLRSLCFHQKGKHLLAQLQLRRKMTRVTWMIYAQLLKLWASPKNGVHRLKRPKRIPKLQLGRNLRLNKSHLKFRKYTNHESLILQRTFTNRALNYLRRILAKMNNSHLLKKKALLVSIVCQHKLNRLQVNKKSRHFKSRNELNLQINVKTPNRKWPRKIALLPAHWRRTKHLLFSRSPILENRLQSSHCKVIQKRTRLQPIKSWK